MATKRSRTGIRQRTQKMTHKKAGKRPARKAAAKAGAVFMLNDDNREALIIAGVDINAVQDIEAVLGGRATIAARATPARKDEEAALHAVSVAARALIAAIDACDELTAGDIDAAVAAARNGEEQAADLAELYDQLHAVADAATRAVGDGRRRGALQRSLANAVRGVFREYDIPWTAERGGPAWTALSVAFTVARAKADDVSLYIQPS